MSILMRNTIPRVILALTTLLLIINFFFTIPTVNTLAEILKRWMVVITTMAIIIATISVNARVSVNILRKGPRWNYQIIQIVSFLLFVVVGLATNLNTTHPVWLSINDILRTPINQAMIASIALSLLAATYRAFITRTFEAALLLGAGIIAILMNVSLLEIWTYAFLNFGTWLMNYPLTAGNRGMLITAGLGLITLGIRTLLGYERAIVRGSEE